jgi:Tol biopolymer transport system component
MTGQRLLHYEITGKLGEGGMGVVYKARDTHLDRFVAIKVLPPGRVADPVRKARFVQEAKSASALNHPNIVTIHDITSDKSGDMSHDFIVMEYVAGKTLDQVIPRRGMRLSEALKIAAQIAGALARAHTAGIVHRDLKPSNVMVDEHGLVKVLDFGLAKLTERRLSENDSTATIGVETEEGTVVGTASYMSPEQAEGKKVDARSDIFSFGALLYEMVTGRRAFRGESKMAILSAVLHKEPPAMEGVPPELEKIVTRCLRKDPERRAQHIDDIKLALQELKEESDSGTAARPPKPARRRWIWIAAAIALPALLVAGFFAWRAWRALQHAEPIRAVALTTFPGVESYPTLSPDGNHVAFTWTGPKQDNPDIYVQQIGSGSPLRLTTDPRSDYNPVWSPDGRWIAFLRGPAGKSELRLIPPLGGPERQLAEIRVREAYVGPPYLAWCPNSACLVATDFPGEGKPDALFVVSVETGEKRQLTNPQPPVLGDSNPAVSPDGRSLIFRRNVAAGTSELYWLPLGNGLAAGGEPRRLTPAALNAAHPAWMPDAKEILFSASGSLWRLAISGGSPPARLPFVGEDGLMPVVSRAQPGRAPRLVYVRSFADSNIWRVETLAPGAPASSPPVAFISSTRSDENPQFSPDGRRVAFVSNRAGEFELWLADPDGANGVQLTSMGARVIGMPCWSPDSQLIAFDSNLEGHYEIFVVPAGGGKPRRVTSGPANKHVPSFSRDGRWIYFSSNRTGEYQIWKIPASGGEAVQVTHNVGWVALESPDGAYVYYTQTGNTASALWRLPTSGGQPVKVLEGVVERAFVVLERGIYYIDQPTGEARLQFFDFATGKSTTVAGGLGQIRVGLLTASPDGRTILYCRVDSSGNDLMLVENFR